MKLFISQFEDIPENNQSGEANNESDEDESLHFEEDVVEDPQDVWGNILAGTQEPPSPHPIAASYCPPLHMRDLDVDAFDNLLMGMQNTTTHPVDGDIEEGMMFHDKQDCLHAIKSFHIRHSVDYTVEQSDHERYVIKCTIQ